MSHLNSSNLDRVMRRIMAPIVATQVVQLKSHFPDWIVSNNTQFTFTNTWDNSELLSCASGLVLI